MTVKHELFERLRALRLPGGDFVVFDTGPLVVRGVIEASNDLDVVWGAGRGRQFALCRRPSRRPGASIW